MLLFLLEQRNEVKGIDFIPSEKFVSVEALTFRGLANPKWENLPT